MCAVSLLPVSLSFPAVFTEGRDRGIFLPENCLDLDPDEGGVPASQSPPTTRDQGLILSVSLPEDSVELVVFADTVDGGVGVLALCLGGLLYASQHFFSTYNFYGGFLYC